MVIGADSGAEPRADVPAGLVAAGDGRRASAPAWRRVVLGACWAAIVVGLFALVTMAVDFTDPIRRCPSWVVTDGGLPVGPEPVSSDLYHLVPADEVRGYEASVQLVPPLVRCRPPQGHEWPPRGSEGPSSIPVTIDRWTGTSVVGVVLLETAAVTTLVLMARQRRRSGRQGGTARRRPGQAPPDDSGTTFAAG